MAVAKRECKQCKEYVRKFIKIPAGVFCDKDCAYKFGSEQRDKKRKRQQVKAEKAERKSHKEAKERIKTTGEFMKEAQAAVNKYIRARDFFKPCVSCGSSPSQKRGGTVDAGHYRSRGAASHLRFNCFNIAAQCVKCNRYKSGNAVDYRIELIRRIGIDRVERLESDNQPRKFTTDYLKRIKKVFNKRARLQLKRNEIKSINA